MEDYKLICKITICFARAVNTFNYKIVLVLCIILSVVFMSVLFFFYKHSNKNLNLNGGSHTSNITLPVCIPFTSELTRLVFPTL